METLSSPHAADSFPPIDRPTFTIHTITSSIPGDEIESEERKKEEKFPHFQKSFTTSLHTTLLSTLTDWSTTSLLVPSEERCVPLVEKSVENVLGQEPHEDNLIDNSLQSGESNDGENSHVVETHSTAGEPQQQQNQPVTEELTVGDSSSVHSPVEPSKMEFNDQNHFVKVSAVANSNAGDSKTRNSHIVSGDSVIGDFGDETSHIEDSNAVGAPADVEYLNTGEDIQMVQNLGVLNENGALLELEEEGSGSSSTTTTTDLNLEKLDVVGDSNIFCGQSLGKGVGERVGSSLCSSLSQRERIIEEKIEGGTERAFARVILNICLEIAIPLAQGQNQEEKIEEREEKGWRKEKKKKVKKVSKIERKEKKERRRKGRMERASCAKGFEEKVIDEKRDEQRKDESKIGVKQEEDEREERKGREEEENREKEDQEEKEEKDDKEEAEKEMEEEKEEKEEGEMEEEPVKEEKEETKEDKEKEEEKKETEEEEEMEEEKRKEVDFGDIEMTEEELHFRRQLLASVTEAAGTRRRIRVVPKPDKTKPDSGRPGPPVPPRGLRTLSVSPFEGEGTIKEEGEGEERRKDKARDRNEELKRIQMSPFSVSLSSLPPTTTSSAASLFSRKVSPQRPRSPQISSRSYLSSRTSRSSRASSPPSAISSSHSSKASRSSRSSSPPSALSPSSHTPLSFIEAPQKSEPFLSSSSSSSTSSSSSSSSSSSVVFFDPLPSSSLDVNSFSYSSLTPINTPSSPSLSPSRSSRTSPTTVSPMTSPMTSPRRVMGSNKPPFVFGKYQTISSATSPIGSRRLAPQFSSVFRISIQFGKNPFLEVLRLSGTKKTFSLESLSSQRLREDILKAIQKLITKRVVAKLIESEISTFSLALDTPSGPLFLAEGESLEKISLTQVLLFTEKPLLAFSPPSLSPPPPSTTSTPASSSSSSSHPSSLSSSVSAASFSSSSPLSPSLASSSFPAFSSVSVSSISSSSSSSSSSVVSLSPRMKIVKELFDTERSYISFLIDMSNFRGALTLKIQSLNEKKTMSPKRGASPKKERIGAFKKEREKNISRGEIGQKEISILFGNLDQLIELNGQFYLFLRKRLNSFSSSDIVPVADSFSLLTRDSEKETGEKERSPPPHKRREVRERETRERERETRGGTPRSPTLSSESKAERVYAEWGMNYSRALEIYGRIKQNRALSDKLKETKVTHDLDALLIAPVQRLPRYLLLISDLIKHTPEEHYDYQDLLSASNTLKKVIENVDNQIQEMENKNVLQDIMKSQPYLTRYLNEGRSVIYQMRSSVRRKVLGNFFISPKIPSSDERLQLYLFNDLLVMVNEDDHVVCQAPANLVWYKTKEKELDKFEIITPLMSCLVFCPDSPSVLMQWIPALRKVIRNSLQLNSNLVSDGDENEDPPESRLASFECFGQSLYHGRWEWGVMNGEGTLISPLFKYEGEWKDGQKHGKGKGTFSNSIQYDGFWKEDAMEGKGTMNYQNGQIYKGDFLGNQKHGIGKQIFSNGEFYDGEWENGVPSGTGSFIYSDSFQYSGDFKEGLFEGIGKLSGGGLEYFGSFASGMKEGEGFVRKEGELIYEGQFSANLYHGNGSLLLSDASTYTGEFSMGLMHGEGTLKRPNEVTYKGSWKKGFKSGRGVISVGNTTLSASFKKGRLHGNALLKTPSCTVEGNFKNGVKDGSFLYRFNLNEVSRTRGLQREEEEREKEKEKEKEREAVVVFKEGVVVSCSRVELLPSLLSLDNWPQIDPFLF